MAARWEMVEMISGAFIDIAFDRTIGAWGLRIDLFTLRAVGCPVYPLTLCDRRP